MSNSVFLFLPPYTYRPDVYLASGISYTVATKIRVYYKGGESEKQRSVLLHIYYVKKNDNTN